MVREPSTRPKVETDEVDVSRNCVGSVWDMSGNVLFAIRLHLLNIVERQNISAFFPNLKAKFRP